MLRFLAPIYIVVKVSKMVVSFLNHIIDVTNFFNNDHENLPEY